MKAHRFMFVLALVCLIKFGVTPTTDDSVWLLPAALGAFLIGCVMGSIADDRKHGDHATRDGIILGSLFLLVTNIMPIMVFILALIIMIFV